MMLRKRPFSFPTDKSVRVICDTDCACECDDQYCVAQMLMTPKFDVKAIISTHFAGKGDSSERESYDEIVKIAELMGIREEQTILHGAPNAMADEYTPVDSEGARFIIEEAMRDDPRPLFVWGMGVITDLASAYLMEPTIAGRLTAIWIGGGQYPEGGWEFNLIGDLNAAKVIFRSDVDLWQVPSNVYSAMKVSYYQLLNHVYPCGEIGRYLVENTMQVNARFIEMFRATADTGSAAPLMGGELWSLGDSSCVGITMNPDLGRWHMERVPCDLLPYGGYDRSRPGSRMIRVYDDIDSQFILNDMFEKLKYNFGVP